MIFFFFYNNVYIKIDLFFIFPLAMTNLSWISIVDIKLMARPLCIAHLVKRKLGDHYFQDSIDSS